MKSKKCKHQGCNNPVWSGGLCKNHIPKKSIPKTKIHIASREGIELFDKAVATEMMHTFFMKIWNKKAHKSEISGKKLYGEPSSAYFHHILPKSKYWEAAFDEENIILMTMDEHNSVENDMYMYALINKRRHILIKKYNLI